MPHRFSPTDDVDGIESLNVSEASSTRSARNKSVDIREDRSGAAPKKKRKKNPVPPPVLGDNLNA